MVQIRSKKLLVTIQHHGAEISSIKNSDGLEFLWQANKDVWARHAPVLFPIVGKLKNNAFEYDHKNYEMGQHGFARDMAFELVLKTQNSCLFQLSSGPQTKSLFPFDFVLQISYSVTDNHLQTSYKVINPSNQSLFFSIGAHPGFRCPLLPTETFEDYYLKFETTHLELTKLNNGLRLDAKEKLQLKNNKLFLTKTLFDNDALVFENSQINHIQLCSSKSQHKITMSSVNWPYFGVWSKKGCTDFICLEPWFGIADKVSPEKTFTKKDGIIELGAKKHFDCSFLTSFD